MAETNEKSPGKYWKQLSFFLSFFLWFDFCSPGSLNMHPPTCLDDNCDYHFDECLHTRLGRACERKQESDLADRSKRAWQAHLRDNVESHKENK